MKIAPIDIAHKTFSRKVMGLDADEVMEFMRDIADQMEGLVRERNSLKEALRQKDIQMMEYKERDETLRATLATATKMSEQIRVDAERESKLITGDAHQKAEVILRDSRDSLRRVYQEIADMKRLRMQFEVNLRALCQAHTAMLDQSHVSMPDPQITHTNQQLNHASTTGSTSGMTTGANNAAGAAPTRQTPSSASRA